ncbi:hypothetical protein Tco_1103564 [Tanacetum coccineum]
MENLSSCDPDVLSEVPYSNSYPNDMINQEVQEMKYSEQTHIDDFQDNEIHKQAFWLKHSSFSKTPITSHTPVRIEAPIELPNVSLVTESLKKLKYQLANFDNVVKKRTTSDAITAAQSQEKDTIIRKLKDRIKSLSGKDSVENVKKDIDEIETINIELEHRKNVVDTAISKPNATIAPGMFKLDIEPISPMLKNNKDAHEVYIEKTIENTNTVHGFVECARTQNPSEPLLESAYMFTKHIQELLVYVSQTCPNSPKPRVKSLGNTSASRSKPSGNTKNNRITRPPSSNQKNKVEDHSRKVKSSLNKTNSASEPISNALVKHLVINAKFESICAICNKCLFDANHDMCIIDYVNDVNVRSKSKSKRNNMRKVWKPTGKLFSEIRYSWKPTGWTFTIVRNKRPLTRITSTKEVPTKETSTKSVATPTQGISVYTGDQKQQDL